MMTQRILRSLLGRNSWVLVLFFLALGAYFTAKLVNVFTYRALRELPALDTPMRRQVATASFGTTHTPAAMVKSILDRNLMGARREDLSPKPAEAPKPEDTNKVMPCTMGASIVGIVSSPSPDWSFVVYRDPRTHEAGVYSPLEGRDQLPGGISLLEVNPGEARFRKDNHVEVCVIWADLTHPAAPSPVTPVAVAASPRPGGDGLIDKVGEHEYAIDQKKIQWVQEHLNEVATDARIVPAFRNGKSQGFKLFSIRPGSVYQQIGLQNGDVIEKINGYEMNSPDKALEIYGKLRDARSIQVQLERRGAPMSLSYQIR